MASRAGLRLQGCVSRVVSSSHGKDAIDNVYLPAWAPAISTDKHDGPTKLSKLQRLQLPGPRRELWQYILFDASRSGFIKSSAQNQGWRSHPVLVDHNSHPFLPRTRLVSRLWRHPFDSQLAIIFAPSEAGLRGRGDRHRPQRPLRKTRNQTKPVEAEQQTGKKGAFEIGYHGQEPSPPSGRASQRPA